ncbi:MAG: triose-phosphate isomerase [Bacteroidia bacterium]
MNRLLVIANWKMNLLPADVESWAKYFLVRYDRLSPLTVAVAPPFPYLPLLKQHLSEDLPVYLAAQNVYPVDFGAYTGEVSAPMLKALGVKYCIVGHSERRQYFGEKETFLAQKVQALLQHEITPIYCVGETLAQRQAGETLSLIQRQLEEALTDVPLEKVIIAYEPVWAIGTGMAATPQDAQAVHAFIRQWCGEKSSHVSILYGGSVHAENAASLFEMPDIDGALVGGASLNSQRFFSIAQALFAKYLRST